MPTLKIPFIQQLQTCVLIIYKLTFPLLIAQRHNNLLQIHETTQVRTCKVFLFLLQIDV